MIIFALTALLRSNGSMKVAEAIRSGDFPTATRLAVEHMDMASKPKPPALDSVPCTKTALLCGDLNLAQGREEEAEDCYRRAVKAAGLGAKGDVRVISCRTTGFLNLYKQRYATAAACLRRIVDDEAASPLHKVEALCALALVHHCLGQQEACIEHLDRAADLAAHGEEATTLKALDMLVVVMRTELRVRHEIRAHAELQDHVFWRTPAQGLNTARHLLAQSSPHPLAVIEACLATHGVLGLVSRHMEFLKHLVRVTCGDMRATQALLTHLAWLRQSQLHAVERSARLEVALVAIVSRQVDVARGALEPLHGRASEGHTQRWSVELSYCLARMHSLCGNTEESIRHYQRYALEAMQCLRAEATEPALTLQMPRSATAPAKDDIEMALTAKYRRAYRYILDHLDCADLSVREIADEIGVTERALQLAFKSQVGMAPAEVIRRCRVERIRKELLQNGGTGASVIETATRWGIANRSTLVSTYRKYFNETPAQTLQNAPSHSMA